MAVLSYGRGENRFDLGPFIRTQQLSLEPVWDSSRREVLYWRLHIQVAGYLHPYGTATNKGAVELLPGGIARQEGDRLGITLANIKNILEIPRGQLIYRVANDDAYVSPMNSLVTGLPFDCDPDGGPYPEPFRALEVVGDRGALFTWGIVAAISNCDKVLLSNRWSTHTHTNEHGFTTRTISGRANFRLDYLTAANLQPDSWRRWFLPYQARNMRRASIDVTQTERGDEVAYTVVDKETAYNVGVGGVTVIEGNATAGMDVPVKNAKVAAERAVRGAAILGGLAWFGPLAWPVMIGPAAAFAWDNLVPSPQANCLVRVNGRRLADKAMLAQLAIAIASDAFAAPAPPGGPAAAGAGGARNKIPVSCYVSQSIGSDDNPWVEARLEWLILSRQTLDVMLGREWPTALMNMRNAPNVYPPGTGLSANPELAHDIPLDGIAGGVSGARGSWLGRLFAQGLKSAVCDLPGEQPAYAAAVELRAPV